jgi:hypothetical protein
LKAVRVLKADPDLSEGIPASELAAANERAVAAIIQIEPPQWDPSPFQKPEMTTWLGLLVLDGLMLRCVTVGRRSSCELFGTGDVIRPWDADGEYHPLAITVTWQVVEESYLAILNDSFAQRVRHWPSISAQLLARVARRARYLALTHTVTHIPRIEDRLVLVFWLLAERWGKVNSDGVRIELPLTHEVLAMLVGARRPSVTVSLGHLVSSEMLERRERHQWQLTRRAIDKLGQRSLNMAGEDANAP